MMAPPDAAEQPALWNISDALESTLLRNPKHLIELEISRAVLDVDERGLNGVATFINGVRRGQLRSRGPTLDLTPSPTR